MSETEGEPDPQPAVEVPDAQYDRVMSYLDELHTLVEGKNAHHIGSWQFIGEATAPILRSSCTECAAVVDVDWFAATLLSDSSIAAIIACPYGRVSRQKVAARNIEWEAEKEKDVPDPELDGTRGVATQFLNQTRDRCEQGMKHDLGKWLYLGTPEAPTVYTSCRECGAGVTVLYDCLEVRRDSMAFLRPCLVTPDLHQTR